MSRLLLFPVVLFIAIPIFFYKLIRFVIRFARRPILESRVTGHYFLVCKHFRQAGLKRSVKVRRQGRLTSVMFYERSSTGNRFVYMFGLDGESMLVSKYVWEGGLSSEDRLKLVRFETGLIKELQKVFPIQREFFPEGESQHVRVKK